MNKEKKLLVKPSIYKPYLLEIHKIIYTGEIKLNLYINIKV